MTDKPKRVANLVEEEMDEDLLVVDFHESHLHTLNPTAAAIWELCDGQNSVEEIARLFAERFNLPAADVLRDVGKVVAEFREKGMIE